MSNNQAAVPVPDIEAPEDGVYEILLKRLRDQGGRLLALVDTLNEQRLEEFGSRPMEILARVRLRTRSNCRMRDVVWVGEHLLFGFNACSASGPETRIEDVFGLYRLVIEGDGYVAQPLALEETWLADPALRKDFAELHTYYRTARLLELVMQQDKLLASFQVGERIDDIRVFRWSVNAGGEQVRYMDNRGERDIARASACDFEWNPVSREMIVESRQPRVSVDGHVSVSLDGGELIVDLTGVSPSDRSTYRYPLLERSQSLQDLELAYVRLADLILLNIRPYKEAQSLYLVCNLSMQAVIRIDAIGQSCRRLPDNHGIIFPGGLYLQSGECKIFDVPMDGMHFKRLLRSPNGEDALYIFHHAADGRSALLTYNLVSRRLQPPVLAHGQACSEDGRMVIFSAEDEPVSVHPVQIWRTAFSSEEHAAQQVGRNTFLGRIGNADLVRAVSDLYDLVREIRAGDIVPSRLASVRERITSVSDRYHWLMHEPTAPIAALLRELDLALEGITGELQSVEHARARAAERMLEARHRHSTLTKVLRGQARRDIQDFVAQLNLISELRGHLLSLRDQRHMDVPALNALEQELKLDFERTAAEAADFMGQPGSLLSYTHQIDTLSQQIETATSVKELEQSVVGLTALAASLDLLSGLGNVLSVDDTARHTLIIEAVSHVYVLMNQATAQARIRRKTLVASESTAQFAAQFQLLCHSVTHGLSLVDTPQACDEQLSKLLIQLEELESRYGEHEPFSNDLTNKREELLEAFEQHRQSLLDVRQHQTQSLQDAALRIFTGLPRRLSACNDIEQLNAFFAADPQILKLRDLAQRLRDLDDSTRADALDAHLKAAHDQAIRAQRDRAELFDGSGKILKLGPRHRFTVNTQALDLTLLPRNDELWVHITGTDFYERLEDDAIGAMSRYFHASFESESESLCRAEYLAWQVLDAAGPESDLHRMSAGQLERHVRDFCVSRYKEGYEKGIHDHDAVLILQKLIPGMAAVGFMRFSPQSRAFALLAWHMPGTFEPRMRHWPRQARSAYSIQKLFGHREGLADLRGNIVQVLEAYAAATGLPATPRTIADSADYLLSLLPQENFEFKVSGYANEIVEALEKRLQLEGCQHEPANVVRALSGDFHGQWSVIGHWVMGACTGIEGRDISRYAPEAVALLLLRLAGKPELAVDHACTTFQVRGLLGDHPTIAQGTLTLTLDDFFTRVREHRDIFVPQMQAYQKYRHEIIQREHKALRIAELTPTPMTSFVRGRLIDDVYLPLIAGNLARQMGAVNEGRQSDRMGVLMLISPPGYGKTTLIEYIAFQLGIAYVKISGPALGYQATSLDPAKAPDGPSRMELEKLNLAIEMGSNVCLLIDDIQHLSPDFLQKFISLCDGSRRIESVWKGKTQHRDLRGKKFCIVMAGNPYTESGQVFKIPDMLVNRADIYNLGEVSAGHSEAFALSYIENCMTANPLLAPLATRDIGDLHRLIEHAQGRPLNQNDLAHDYSRSEIDQLVLVLRRLLEIRNVLIKVNGAYIDSAAQGNEYRTEPPFRLQGSYRNMNRLAERVSAAMNEAEVDELITDHYRGEAQMLSGGAEENLLKLAELRGRLCPEQEARWSQIKAAFVRNSALGAAARDTEGRIVARLGEAVDGIRAIAASCATAEQKRRAVESSERC